MLKVEGYKSNIEVDDLLCTKCKVKMENSQIQLHYIGRSFTVEVPVCPKCGQKYISEELARGKMASVEMLLEDK